MKKLILTLVLLSILFSYRLKAQTLAGEWYGVLNVQGSTLPLVYHIKQIGDVYLTTLDSPDQSVFGIAAQQTTFTGNQLSINMPSLGARYLGVYQPDSNKITGTFTQGPGSFPLVLTRTKKIIVRPQDPTSFPYKQEEVIFTNLKAGDKLSGTLTMPPSGKLSKIVVLITGSGPQNRNEELKQFNHRPFLVWSDWLTRNGIAVLRYDDRGVAKSTGDFATATTADFADDAEAAVNYISSRPDLKTLSIGLIGHSEGGIIAPIVAGRNKNVKFIVLLAGTGIPSSELTLQQQEDLMKLDGADSATIAKVHINTKKIYQVIIQNKNLSADLLKVKLNEVIPNPDADNQMRMTRLISQPWFRYFTCLNPADYLAKITCPVLALNGTLDVQVRASSNLPAIKSSLQKAGNKNFELVPMPGLNHLFQKAETGGINEYSTISETVNPAALKKVSDWITHLP